MEKIEIKLKVVTEIERELTFFINPSFINPSKTGIDKDAVKVSIAEAYKDGHIDFETPNTTKAIEKELLNSTSVSFVEDDIEIEEWLDNHLDDVKYEK